MPRVCGASHCFNIRCRGSGRETVSALNDYLDMEQRWLALARSYEFAERLSRFTAPFSKGKNRRTVGDLIKKNRRVYKPRPVGERGPSTPSTGRAGKSLPWLR